MNKKNPSPRDRDQRGIALLAVVWTITLLFLVSMMLSESVQSAAREASYRRESARAYAMACGGVEAAAYQMAYAPAADSKPEVLGWAWRPGQRAATIRMAEGRVELEIVNEFGKLDLNSAGPEQLARLFETHGKSPAAATDLARAVIHWRSPASDSNEDAALESYYQARAKKDERQQPRHAPFVTVEEALGVRGITREVFFGNWKVTDDGKIRLENGVGRDLTVRSRSAQVNINYASEHVLRSVPGLGSQAARQIVDERRKEPFQSVAEVGQRTALILPEESMPFLTTAEGKIYSITATGAPEGSRVRRSVRAVVQVGVPGNYRHRTIAWYDEANDE